MQRKRKRDTMVEAYLRVRKTWSIKPVTKVKGNDKGEASKKACRGKKGKGDERE